MIRDHKAIDQAQSEITRLRRGVEVAGLWFFVVFVSTAALAGWWLT